MFEGDDDGLDAAHDGDDAGLPAGGPASSARLAAMAAVILRATYSREADPAWAAELIKRAERVSEEDAQRLQGELDRWVDELNEGEDEEGDGRAGDPGSPPREISP